MNNSLLYGTAYYYEYLPYDRMEEDFSMMNEAGINTIRIAESTWSTWEPSDGVFDFTYLHRMLKCAASHHLNVIIGTPTYAIPSWLAMKYPDILSETHNGRCKYGPRQNFDITHPGYLFHAERIIRKLMEEVSSYNCIIGYQLDNETKPYDTCSKRAQDLFKEYLKKKWPDVKDLNARMGFAYWSNSIATYDDLPDVRATINASFGAEYEAFSRELVTNFLKWQRDIVDEYRKPWQFVTHNFDYEWRMSSFGLQPEADQFEAAKNLTIAGCDIYHPSEDNLTGATITFCGALARGLKKANYLVMETEAQGNFGWLPYPGQLRMQAFSHIACGADGVSYWHWHSIHNAVESYWKGILSHDFSKGAVYKEAVVTGNDIKRLSPYLINLKKNNKIAIMVSNRSQIGLKWFPTDHQQSDNIAHTYSDYLRQFTDALYMLNVEYDIINDDCRDFSDYEIIIAPVLYACSRDLSESLKKYVHDGGRLISGFKSFFADKYLKIYHDSQPSNMTEVFGISYDRFTKPDNVSLDSDKIIFDKPPVVTDWMELIDNVSPDTEVLCSYKHHIWKNLAAVTSNRYGKGEAVYIGCYFDSTSLKKIMTFLLNRWNFLLHSNSFPIVIKEGFNNSGNKITYYFNYSGDENKAVIESSGTELLSSSKLSKGNEITISPWNFIIVES